MARRNNARKESLWVEWVRRWRQSQLSVRAFCARERLSEPNFYAWRRVLRERGLLDEGWAAQEAGPLVDPGTRPAFLEVAPEALAAHASAHTSAYTSAHTSAHASALDVVLGESRVVRVRPGFDAATLRQLLRVLEEPSC